MASCMECTHFNPCNSHGKIIVEKPTEGNDWGLHNNVENECKYFTPTADVVEVRHAEWEAKEHTSTSKRGRSIHYATYRCSECKKWNGKHRQNYCPSCGAKMDGRCDT